VNAEWFKPAPQEVFFRSQKSGDQRFGELAQNIGAEVPDDPSFIIAGYPDDEGIKLNRGRQGAAEAPDRIRHFFYKTTPAATHQSPVSICDCGNLELAVPLAERHQRLLKTVEKALSKKHRWIGLGGGHDYAYPDGAGFLLANQNSKNKPLIINIDAHLDVRPTDNGLSSGTPFYRLLTDEQLPDFDLLEVGIQGQCNSLNHLNWAREKKVEVISFEEIMMSGQSQSVYLSERLAPHLLKRRPTFLSIDIDGFASAYAMGCSQSWSTGFIPNEIFPFFNNLYGLLDVQILGIYEVSPPLDLDDRTVKLASQLIHQYINPLL